jgi:thiol-disulfide isomerase/thioredoxin
LLYEACGWQGFLFIEEDAVGRYLLIFGLILAAVAVGLTVIARRSQTKPAAVASIPAPSAPAIRGKPAADFELPNLEGSQVRMAAFKNKVVLVNFWATWCAPCIVEIPWFIEFQKKYGPQGLEIVGISMDDTGAKDVVPFVKKHGMTYTVLLGDDNVAEKFGGILGLPTTFLVDRNGKYYSIHRGLVNHDAIEKELQTLLGNPSPSAPATSNAPANEPERRGTAPASSPEHRG